MKQFLWSATVRLTGQVNKEHITVSTEEKNIAQAASKAIEMAAEKFPETATDVIEVKYDFTFER